MWSQRTRGGVDVNDWRAASLPASSPGMDLVSPLDRLPSVMEALERLERGDAA